MDVFPTTLGLHNNHFSQQQQSGRQPHFIQLDLVKFAVEEHSRVKFTKLQLNSTYPLARCTKFCIRILACTTRHPVGFSIFRPMCIMAEELPDNLLSGRTDLSRQPGHRG